jgi:hypothetical protein
MKKTIDTELIGTWNIYEMDEWDEDYLHEEGQAFIEIKENGLGEFHFAVVSANIDGEMSEKKFEFTWEGMDEGDEISGRGWVKKKGKDKLDGYIKIHCGDSSKFKAEKTEG